MEQALSLHRWRIGLGCLCTVGLAFSLSLLFLFTSSTPLLHSAHYLWLQRLLFKIPSDTDSLSTSGEVTPSHLLSSVPSSSTSSPPFTLTTPFGTSQELPASSENGTSYTFYSPAMAAPPASAPSSLWPHETSINLSSGTENVGSKDLHLPTQGLDPPSPPSYPETSPAVPHVKKPFGSAPQCDISQGKWIQDGSSYPLYKPGSCPYVDEAFSCQENGRPDSGYLKWRWQPTGCELPIFSGQQLLERLRGKRMVFAGDSLMRNQWESMLCLLREGLPNKSRMMEMRGARITKGRGDYVFKFLDYNARVEFYRSHFLVAEGTRKKPGSRKSRLTLRIDTIDKTSKKWRQADVLVFTTGHWWTHGKTARGKDYFQEGEVVHESLPVMVAFKKAIETWGSWLDKNVNPKLTKVFFCSYSPSHFNGGQWNSGGQCQTEKDPFFDESFIPSYPEKMQVIEEVIGQMKTPVQILNVTRLSEFRKDAHPSLYGQVPQQNPTKGRGPRQDCSHWCLPGLPDTWNEVLCSFL